MENKKIVTTAKSLLANQFVRYLIIGGLNTVISYIIFKGLESVFWKTTIFTSIAYIIAQFSGILVSYVLNSTLTFKRKLSVKGFLAFAGPLVFLQLVVSGGGMYWFLNQGMNKDLAFVILTGINVILGFLLTKISLNIFTDKA